MTTAQNLYVLFLFLPIAAIAQGFAVSKLWTWFVENVFSNVHIGVCHAIGLIILFNVIVLSGNKTDRDFEDYVTLCMGAAFTCLVFVFMGWIFHGLM
jgi:hypothetical protein